MGKVPVRSSIAKIPPYRPGTSSHDIGRPIVKLSSNENAYGPSPRAIAAVSRAAPKINLYPDKEGRALRTALSRHLDIPAASIALGNGSDEVLDNLSKIYLEEGTNMVTHSTFSTYRTVALSCGAETRVAETPPEAGIDIAALMDACDERTRILLVCSPDNPTGAIVDEGAVGRLVDFCSDRGVFLVMDEAYADFSEEYASPAERFSREGLEGAVSRTFSKAYGLAGLRVGYCISSEEVISRLNLVRMPFNVSSVAQDAALAALGDQDHYRSCVERVRRGREELSRGIASLGMVPYPSEANFVLASVKPVGFTASGFAEAVLETGFAVRDCTSFGLPEHVRISVGTEEQIRDFLQALSGLLS
jgi:histidinol-phosphate aminotransferase